MKKLRRPLYLDCSLFGVYYSTWSHGQRVGAATQASRGEGKDRRCAGEGKNAEEELGTLVVLWWLSAYKASTMSKD